MPEAPLLQGFLPIPSFGWAGTLAAFGGLGGVLLGVALLKFDLLRYSFSDYDDYLQDGEVLADYPHARAEHSNTSHPGPAGRVLLARQRGAERGALAPREHMPIWAT